MKVGIVGAGAIGGCIGIKLAASGAAAVSVLARGKTLAALRENGWRLRSGNECLSVHVKADDDPGKIGVQEILIIAVKGNSLPELAPNLKPMIGPETVLVPAMNGVPWWFCKIDSLGFAPFSLKSVDPSGKIEESLPLAQTLGCAVHMGASCLEPGLVQHTIGWDLMMGEPSGEISERLDRVSGLLERAGLKIKRSSDVRNDIWYKLWGNMTSNPISAITGATLARIVDDPIVREFSSAMMREATAIGERVGCRITQSPEDRHAITRTLGDFKTSMLQDVEAGRAMELDTLVGAVREMGQRIGIPTPNIDVIFGLTRLFGRVHGIYPEASS
ncbi:MAG: 2-dehydropantoate 2-reductase [Candidatus Accumulibacter sp.]|jgi:2-dehydropantoate 2-reductase|nr:2-dehydropantoate 2-reductase [Accumulibacter sp.]